jgi:hypothetical protein
MKKIIFSAIALSLVIISISSCKKEETPTATITFNEPLTNDSITNGDSLHAEGTITGTGELHGYTLIITNKTSGAVLYTSSASNHSDSYAFHEHWLNNVSSTSNIDVKVEVELDHDGNKTAKAVQVVALN